MNRLERMIARLATQHACLNAAAKLVEHLEGPVLEIGLGKGRTYSHLRHLFPGREIFAFDWDLRALPGAHPDADHMVLGEIRETLPTIAGRLDRPAVLAHADTGSEERPDPSLARDIAGPIARLVCAQGLVLSDRALRHGRLEDLDLPSVELPSGIGPWPYYMYRVTKG